MEYEPVQDLNHHRKCDISTDRKIISIVRDGCVTYITANPDGTLNVRHELLPAA